MVLRVPSKRSEKKVAAKSGKQRRAEIIAHRKKRAPVHGHIDFFSLPENWPKGAVAANREALQHNNTYGLLPHFYVDKPFVCRDCKAEEVWRATQQKWWYEVTKGHIDTTAVRCRACRRKERERKIKVREISVAGLLAKRERLKGKTP
jgi:Probable zinc-ribbon domain